jgi:hypothetical protein
LLVGNVAHCRKKTIGASKSATTIPEVSTLRSNRRLTRRITVVASQYRVKSPRLPDHAGSRSRPPKTRNSRKNAETPQKRTALVRRAFLRRSRANSRWSESGGA